MSNRSRYAIVLCGAVLAWAPRATAQDAGAGPGSSAMRINRAGRLYQEREYASCVKELDALLADSPDHMTARFLRALAHGQIAVNHEQQGRTTVQAALILHLSEIESLTARKTELTGQLEDASEKEAVSIRTEISEINTRLQAIRSDAAKAAQEHNLAAQDSYQRMKADIDALMAAGLTDSTAIVSLLDGITSTKLARFAEDTQPSERQRLLANAESALRAYLAPPAASDIAPPAGLNRVRGIYFLGVILYRSGVQPGAIGERNELDRNKVDTTRLAQAQEFLQSLVREDSDEFIGKLLPDDSPEGRKERQTWLSYAHLYLGLVQTWNANVATHAGSPVEAERLLKSARHSLRESREADTLDGKSLSFDTIPEIVDDQMQAIDRAIADLDQARPAETEDLLLEWHSGFAYDTNVILLGKNTLEPSGIGNEDDFVFKTGFALSYTLDLGRVDDQLERWTLGLLGRSSASWHSEIDAYDEQDYGGAAAIQYRLLDAWETDDKVQHGPLYATLQFDHDYFFLGNDDFLRVNRLNPRLSLFMFDQRLNLTASFFMEDRDYRNVLYDNRFDRDGDYLGINLITSYDALDMCKVFNDLGWESWGAANDPQKGEWGYERWLRPYFGGGYEWDSTAGTEFDAGRTRLFAGIEVPLPCGVDFEFGGEWEWEDYSGFRGGSLVDFHRRPREDFIQTYRFGLERRFALEKGQPQNRTELKIDRVVLIIRADVRYTIDDSNVQDRLGQAIFSYDRTVYGVSFALQFN